MFKHSSGKRDGSVPEQSILSKGWTHRFPSQSSSLRHGRQMPSSLSQVGVLPEHPFRALFTDVTLSRVVGVAEGPLVIQSDAVLIGLAGAAYEDTVGSNTEWCVRAYHIRYSPPPASGRHSTHCPLRAQNGRFGSSWQSSLMPEMFGMHSWQVSLLGFPGPSPVRQ